MFLLLYFTAKFNFTRYQWVDCPDFISFLDELILDFIYMFGFTLNRGPQTC